jgi:hypothetical protein
MRRHPSTAPCAASALGCALGMLTLAGCMSLHRPADVALALETDVRSGDITSGEHLGSLSVYTVIASSSLGGRVFEGCRPDMGGGVRCTFLPNGCGNGDDATLTMHLEAIPNGTYRITAAAIAGIYRTADSPDFGTVVYLEACGLRGTYTEPEYAELDPFLSSEIYSARLVPWPYTDPPVTRGDTSLVASRLATNHGATADAIAALQQALAAGEDTASVVKTAVVEAAFTLGLHLAAPTRIDPAQKAPRFIWNHDPEAYPTDTALLRRAIAWLDFAMQVPHPGVDWHKVAVLGNRGRTITFTYTPSIAAMEEMNGIAHYLLGRALTDAANRAQSCALWTSAHEALAAGFRYIEGVPQVDEADDVDARLTKAAAVATQQSDSVRLRVCRSSS